ncbi:zf-TFIIB domain-containing protein [Stackebrandtia soli]|uniref:TFIIB-type zinc ribbon-containing protein n=1 Tax=Stackebrandtia soli TaxID=1892856 RepID=UPI0039EB30E5
MEMTCPKCHAKMRQFERNGVTIDQCTECRGIFLDRGELEHLIDADAKFNSPGSPTSAPPKAAQPPPAPVAPQPGAYPPPPAPAPYGHGGYGQPHYKHGGYGQPHYKHGYRGGAYGHKKRRKSFFEELFD